MMLDWIPGRMALVLCAAVAIAACGGGGGSSDGDGDGGGGDANDPPVFTSGTSGNAPEEQTDAGYTAQADDPEGDTVTFGLVGGADQAAFGIDPASGVLTFTTAPDFENPTDSDSDNAYVVEIEASDGNGGTVTQTVTVSVTDVRAFTAASVAEGDDPKEFAFAWTFDPPADAFRLEVNPDGASGFTPVDVNGDGTVDANDELAGSQSALDLPIPLHLTDFTNALYQVVALDSDGSELDRSDELSILDIVIEQLIGYFKASNTDLGDEFGSSVALSGDGDTLAVGASDENSNATGINNNEADNSFANAGAVYVFTRDDTGTWSQQAYVKASNTDANDFFGSVVALSGDGDTLAVGADDEDSSDTGVTPGSPNDAATGDGADGAGAVYVFTRDGTGTWSQQAYVKASNTDAGDSFGDGVALSGDGDTLAVGATGEGSSATGINSEEGETDDSADSAGAVYVFTRDGTGTWSQQAYVKASNTEAGDFFGEEVALSGDGDTLAVGAKSEDSAATGINGDETEDCAVDDNCAELSGAVYVFTRDGVSDWSQQAYVKASNTGDNDRFGDEVALSGDGDTLAVGAKREESNATGIDGDQTDDSLRDAGAVYVFTRDDIGTWSQQAYVKASNTGTEDDFGEDVALSGDGDTLAVGAEEEDSNATGIDGDQTDDSLDDAGAVYLY